MDANVKPGVLTIPVGFVTVKLMDDDKIAACVERDGSFEPESLKAWDEACADGRAQTAIDVGAYAGLFAISAALMGNHAIAIEGKPLLAERVARNAKWNRADVIVVNAAASNRDGTGEFFMNGAKHSVISSLTRDPKHNRSQEVRVLKLDSLPGIKGKVGAIKIDVEGHESEVLEGALQIIERDWPVLLIETLDDETRKRRAISMIPPRYHCAGFLDGRNLHMVPE